MKHRTALALAFSTTLSSIVSPAFSAEAAAFTVRVTGHGAPMILIPGLASSGEVWDSAVAHFDDTHTCHVLTLAGFAGTPAATAEGPFLGRVRENLASYIRDHGLGRPVIVGHSLGGFLALDLAAKHPDLPGRLVIVDSLPFIFGVMQPGATIDDARRASDAMSASFPQMDAEAYGRSIRGGPNGSTMAAKPADLDRIIAWGLASDGPTVAKAMGEMFTTDLRPELGRIKAPALVFAAWVGYAPYSSHDIVDRIYRDQYAGLADTRIEITDTARHFIMLDEPEWLFARIDDFLAGATTPVVSLR